MTKSLRVSIDLSKLRAADTCECLTWRAANENVERILDRSQPELCNEVLRMCIDDVARLAVRGSPP